MRGSTSPMTCQRLALEPQVRRTNTEAEGQGHPTVNVRRVRRRRITPEMARALVQLKGRNTGARRLQPTASHRCRIVSGQKVHEYGFDSADGDPSQHTARRRAGRGWLRKRFTRQPQWRAFVDWKQYYAASSCGSRAEPSGGGDAASRFE